MADEEKTLDVILKYGVDSGSVGQAQTSVDKVTASLRTQTQELRTQRMALREMSQVFSLIGLAGAAVWVPAIKAANDYLKATGQNEEASRRWTTATQGIKDATIDIGRVVVNDLLPAYEKAAQLAERFAAWAEKNPKAVGAALNIAGALVAIAAAGKVFVEVDRAIVDIQLVAATLMSKAAKDQLIAAGMMDAGGKLQMGAIVGTVAAFTGAVMVFVGSLLAGALVAKTAFDKLMGTSETWGDIANTFRQAILSMVGAALDAYKVLHIISNKQASDIWAALMPNADLNKGVFGGGGGGTTGGGKPAWYDQGLTEYENYQKSLVTNQKTYDDAMAANDKDANQQILDLDASFQKSRTISDRDFNQSEQQGLDDFNESQTKSVENFQRSEAQSRDAYYKSRLDASQSYSQAAYQAEQAHQIEMLRLSEDHNDKMVDLTASRDGLGMIREMRSYEKSRSRAEQDYNLASTKRNQDYAKQISDMETNFKEQDALRWDDFYRTYQEAQDNYNKQDARRKAAYAQQKADEDQNLIDQKNQIIKNHNDKMDLLWTNLQDENDLVTKSFNERLAVMDGYLGQSGKALAAQEAIYKTSYSLLVGQLGQYGTTTPLKLRDTGGYAMPGSFENRSGQPEWVMSPNTTKYAESIVGGHLTQQNLIAAMIQGRSSAVANSSVYNDKRTMNLSGMTAQDRLIIRDEINRAVNTKLKEELA